MFDWSKMIMKKIENGNRLDKHEMAEVEIALRIYDIFEQAMDETLGLDEKSLLELKYKICQKDPYKRKFTVGDTVKWYSCSDSFLFGKVVKVNEDGTINVEYKDDLILKQRESEVVLAMDFDERW